MVTRILIWSLFDSMSTLEELREHLPMLPDGDVWGANEAQDRFGLISFGELPDLGQIPELSGTEPGVSEEFDVE